MSIRKLFKQKKTVVSFEIFPPKASSPLESIFPCVQELQKLQPDFISVTYGAGGSSRGRTLEVAQHIQEDHSIPALGHLTCVGSTAAEMNTILNDFSSHGLRNILALRGDLPAGSPPDTQLPIPHAEDLVGLIRTQEPDFTVAAAAYPEGHSGCPDLDSDIYYLKTKVNRGVDFLISQICFDNNLFLRFWEKAQNQGITIPMSAGIMPIFSSSQIKHITSLCGTSLPQGVRYIMERYGHEPQSMEQAGLEYACKQVENLKTYAVRGFHLYTMNRPHLAKFLVENLNLLEKTPSSTSVHIA